MQQYTCSTHHDEYREGGCNTSRQGVSLVEHVRRTDGSTSGVACCGVALSHFNVAILNTCTINMAHELRLDDNFRSEKSSHTHTHKCAHICAHAPDSSRPLPHNADKSSPLPYKVSTYMSHSTANAGVVVPQSGGVIHWPHVSPSAPQVPELPSVDTHEAPHVHSDWTAATKPAATRLAMIRELIRRRANGQTVVCQ